MALLSDIINWLRAGYPEGVPEQDYIPLLALLGRHLTEDEVDQIAAQLGRNDARLSRESIHAAIARTTREPPHESDIARVTARLAAGGWPLEWPRVN